MSDLHLEWHKDSGSLFINNLVDTENQVAVIAGDLTACSLLEKALNLLCNKFKEVVYITGNHEYYMHRFSDVEEQLKHASACNNNLHWLNNSSVIIDSKCIHGGTLWFPRTKDENLYAYKFSDFIHIKDSTNIHHAHYAMRRYLEQHVAPGDIVVSHHMPTQRSIHPRYEGDPYNRFFACNLDKMIQKLKPSIWVHGHTHSSNDYMLENTRIICNPYGYANHEENPDFNEYLVINC